MPFLTWQYFEGEKIWEQYIWKMFFLNICLSHIYPNTFELRYNHVTDYIRIRLVPSSNFFNQPCELFTPYVHSAGI